MKKKLISAALAAVLALSAAGCSTAGATPSSPPSEPIKIATKPMTEQYLLGEILKQLIEAKTPYQAEVTEGIGGGTSNIQPAMEKGEFDLYPEYTSSGWVIVLKHTAGEAPGGDLLAALQAEYTENYQMTWLGLYGFNNTYTVAVRKAVADQYGLKTCSDLAAVSGELVFGGNPDYLEREDGFPGMSAAYSFQFKDVKDIDIGLKYQALASGEVDAINAYTTDAQLSTGDAVALEDDLGYQVDYYCSTVVRLDALERYPELEETLHLMDGLINDQEMAAMNYAVSVDAKDEAEVAHAYLASKGLLEG